VAVHSYIMSFVRAAQATGYEVSALRMTNPQDATLLLRWKRSAQKEVRVWVETRRNARGVAEQYGYVSTYDATLGAPRLIDWTTLSTRAEFRMEANGAGKTLINLIRR